MSRAIPRMSNKIAHMWCTHTHLLYIHIYVICWKWIYETVTFWSHQLLRFWHLITTRIFLGVSISRGLLQQCIAVPCRIPTEIVEMLSCFPDANGWPLGDGNERQRVDTCAYYQWPLLIHTTQNNCGSCVFWVKWFSSSSASLLHWTCRHAPGFTTVTTFPACCLSDRMCFHCGHHQKRITVTPCVEWNLIEFGSPFKMMNWNDDLPRKNTTVKSAMAIYGFVLVKNIWHHLVQFCGYYMLL